MPQKEVRLTKERDTKHTVRYDADSQSAAVTSLYVSHAAVEALGKPNEIVLTIAPAEEAETAPQADEGELEELG